MSNLPATTTTQDEFAIGIQRAMFKSDMITRMLETGLLVKDVDYGVIPGVAKPSLLKPGAEKLMTTLRYRNELIPASVVERFDGDSPLFHYRYECRIYEVETGAWIATGIGSCNSMEAKYRYRNVERMCPECGKSTIIKGKAEFGGGYICFAKKGGCGAKFGDNDPSIVNQEVGQIVNPDPFSLINTIDKMAQKRALIAAVLIATNASQRFTQDVEDMPGFGYSDMVIEVPAEPQPVLDPQKEAIKVWYAQTQRDFPALTKEEILQALGVTSLLDYGDWCDSKTPHSATEDVTTFVVNRAQGELDPEPEFEKLPEPPDMGVPPELADAPGLVAKDDKAAERRAQAFRDFWQQKIVKERKTAVTSADFVKLFGAGFREDMDWNSTEVINGALEQVDALIKSRKSHPGAVFSKKPADKADGVQA